MTCIVHDERIYGRHHGRGLAADRGLLRRVRRAATSPDRHCCGSARCIAPSLAIGTRITNTGVVKWNDPPQTASASVSIDVGGIAGVGILNGTAWHDANFNGVLDSQRAPARGLDGRALSQRRALAIGTDGCQRHLPDQRHRAELRRPRIATSCGSSRLAPGPTPPSSAERSRSSLTTCSASRTSSCRPAAICRISICRSSRTASSTTRSRARRLRARSSGCCRPAAARRSLQLLLRSGAAGPGHARERLLPVRHQLLRSGVREWRRATSSMSRLPRIGLRCAATRRSFRRRQPVDRSVLGAHLSGERGDAIPGTAQHCEVQTSEFAPRAHGAAAQRGHATTTCT